MGWLENWTLPTVRDLGEDSVLNTRIIYQQLELAKARS
jgi:hypothetical protein